MLLGRSQGNDREMLNGCRVLGWLVKDSFADQLKVVVSLGLRSTIRREGGPLIGNENKWFLIGSERQL